MSLHFACSKNVANFSSYGDDKGACENIFSYGFLEDTMSSAHVMFLNLDIPDDDPLRPAKIYVCNTAPGFRLTQTADSVEWEGDFVWLVVVNEEDGTFPSQSQLWNHASCVRETVFQYTNLIHVPGIAFKVQQTVEGDREIQAFWKDNELDDVSRIRTLLEQDPLWEVFQLRAVVLMQGRVHAQIEYLRSVGNPARENSVRESEFTATVALW